MEAIRNSKESFVRPKQNGGTHRHTDRHTDTYIELRYAQLTNKVITVENGWMAGKVR